MVSASTISSSNFPIDLKPILGAATLLVDRMPMLFNSHYKFSISLSFCLFSIHFYLQDNKDDGSEFPSVCGFCLSPVLIRNSPKITATMGGIVMINI